MKSLRAVSNLILVAGAFALMTGVALAWNAQSLKALPPPLEETGEETAPGRVARAASADQWRNCSACHWEIAGGDPPPREARSRHEGPAARDQTERFPQSEQGGSVETPTPLPRYTPTPLPESRNKGGLPQRLAIPSVEIDGKIVPARASALEGGTEWEVPWEDIAWYIGTALPGNRGNTVMAGHVITRSGGGVFRNLHRVRKDTPIYVYATEGVLTYSVTGIRTVLPSEMSVLNETAEPTLVLITCTGDFDEASRTFSHRLVVTARLVDGG